MAISADKRPITIPPLIILCSAEVRLKTQMPNTTSINNNCKVNLIAYYPFILCCRTLDRAHIIVLLQYKYRLKNHKNTIFYFSTFFNSISTFFKFLFYIIVKKTRTKHKPVVEAIVLTVERARGRAIVVSRYGRTGDI